MNYGCGSSFWARIANPRYRAPEKNNLGDLVDRNIDTEYKILTEIAEKLGKNVNATGKIRLFTERAPCNSCSNVIELFSKKYQKLEIEIIHNNGNMLIDF
ncbi:hypothetical protein FPG59_16315 [Flavobacterium sp. FPG59]|nr:hypothetical protein FPG59_16315 [Flavobacterium sp. FPG59]